MQDGIIKGTGNSRYLKSISNFLAQYPTYQDFVAALVAGTLPIDLNGINGTGWDQLGTALNKANLLSDETAALYTGLPENPTPDDVFKNIFYNTKKEALVNQVTLESTSQVLIDFAGVDPARTFSIEIELPKGQTVFRGYMSFPNAEIFNTSELSSGSSSIATSTTQPIQFSTACNIRAYFHPLAEDVNNPSTISELNFIIPFHKITSVSFLVGRASTNYTSVPLSGIQLQSFPAGTKVSIYNEG